MRSLSTRAVRGDRCRCWPCRRRWSNIMTSALVSKELRETAAIALLGLAVLLLVAAVNIGFSPLSLLGLGRQGRGNEIPFVGDSFVGQFGLAAFALAAVLGFRQALADF